MFSKRHCTAPHTYECFVRTLIPCAQREEVSSCLHFLKVIFFNHECILNISNFFLQLFNISCFYSLIYSWVSFSMLIIILVLNKPYISKLNPTWSGYVTNLVHCKSQFSNILLLTLCLFHYRQCVCVSRNSFFLACYAGLIKWLESISLLYLFWRDTERVPLDSA